MALHCLLEGGSALLLIEHVVFARLLFVQELRYDVVLGLARMQADVLSLERVQLADVIHLCFLILDAVALRPFLAYYLCCRTLLKGVTLVHLDGVDVHAVGHILEGRAHHALGVLLQGVVVVHV
jgi:hypothetical protein